MARKKKVAKKTTANKHHKSRILRKKRLIKGHNRRVSK